MTQKLSSETVRRYICCAYNGVVIAGTDTSFRLLPGLLTGTCHWEGYQFSRFGTGNGFSFQDIGIKNCILCRKIDLLAILKKNVDRTIFHYNL